MGHASGLLLRLTLRLQQGVLGGQDKPLNHHQSVWSYTRASFRISANLAYPDADAGHPRIIKVNLLFVTMSIPLKTIGKF
jgi:hypothetical protein